MTWCHARLGMWVIPLGAWLIAWQGSLQHETIHGHPTRSRLFNTVLGFTPLALWLPYGAYRRAHLAHHRSEGLTHPDADPESRYRLAPASRRERIGLRIAAAQSTLLGRLLFGPIIEVAAFWASEIQRLVRLDAGAWRDWSAHAVGVAAVVLWLRACGFDLIDYALLVVYPGLALSLLRSFAEHRADPDPRRRVAVVERAPILGLLFLNNNLHAAHHLRPDIAWWRLPSFYREQRTELLHANGGLVYRGYGEIARRFALRPHDQLIHPGETL